MSLAVSSFPTKAQEGIQFPNATTGMQQSLPKSSIRDFFRPQERNASHSSLPETSGNSGHRHSLSTPINSSPVKCSSRGMASDEPTPVLASSQSRPCCRRCGRQIPPGGKRNVVSSTNVLESHPIEEVPKNVVAQPASPPIIPEPVKGRNNRAATTSLYIPAAASQITRVARPVSTFSTSSNLVERTRGIMASLAPTHDPLSTQPLRPPGLKRSSRTPANATFPKTGRPNSVSVFVSASMPNQREHGGRKTYPPLHESYATTDLADELGWRNRDVSPSPRVSSPSDLSAGRLSPPLPSKTDVDNASIDPTSPPLYLDLPLSDNTSVLSMSGFLRAIFDEKSSPESKSDVAQEEGFSKSDSVLLDLGILPEYPEPTTPMKFMEDGDDGMEDMVSARHFGKKYKSWNAKARRNSRKQGKLTVRWGPESWSRPEVPLKFETAEKLHPDEQSSNTVSSLDETPPLKPLTYLIHHKNTSSVDVRSSSDHQDSKKTSTSTGSEDDDEQTTEEAAVIPGEEGVVITTRQPRQPRARKSVWEESAVLEVIPRLRELKVAKARNRR